MTLWDNKEGRQGDEEEGTTAEQQQDYNDQDQDNKEGDKRMRRE